MLGRKGIKNNLQRRRLASIIVYSYYTIAKLKRRMNFKDGIQYFYSQKKYLKALELINKWERVEIINIPSIVKYWKADCLIKTGESRKGVAILENILKEREGEIKKSNEMNILRLIAEEKSKWSGFASDIDWEQYFKRDIQPNVNGLLGCKRDYIEIDKNKIEDLQDRLKSEGLEIHISRSQAQWEESKKWRSIIYLHIQKCGGIAFLEPLISLQESIKRISKKRNLIAHDKGKLWLRRSLTTQAECNVLISQIKKYRWEKWTCSNAWAGMGKASNYATRAN